MEQNGEARPFPWQERGGLTGHWLKRAYTAMRRQLETELRQLGLTHAQWSALGLLYYREGLTHTDLERHMLIEAPSITSLITGMEKKGWVERRQHPMDARIKQIYITEQGRRMIEPALQLGKEGDERLKGLLSETELNQLKETLRKIALHLEG
ncbi:MarR family winged helix-turn-helix transcriptional regulator [Paenibacillus tarimensis]